MASPWAPATTTHTPTAAVRPVGPAVFAHPVPGPGIAYACPAGAAAKVLLLNAAGDTILQQSASGVIAGTFTGLTADTAYRLRAVATGGGPGPNVDVSTWLPSDAGITAPSLIPTLSRRAGLLFQDLARTTPATAAGHPVRVIGCPFLRGTLGAGGDWVLASGTPGTLRSDGYRYWLDTDDTANYDAGAGMSGGAYTVGIAARVPLQGGTVQISTTAANVANLSMGSNIGWYYSGGWQGGGSPWTVTDTLVWKFSGSTGQVYRNGASAFTGAYTNGAWGGWRYGGSGYGRPMLTYAFLGLPAALNDATRVKFERFLGYFYKSVAG